MAESKTPLRVLFCICVNQNFMDATAAEMGQVWQAFSTMMKEMNSLPGARIIATLDDDRSMVGPSKGYPFTCYFMTDMPDYDTVVAACNLFRTIPVGDGTYKLWKYCSVETRIGRELQVPT